MKKLAFVALVVAAVWWMRDDDESKVTHGPGVQAAVLTDGFAIVVGHDQRRVIEFDRSGSKQHEMPLRVSAHDVRIVGTRAGTAVGYQHGKKMELALLDSEGNVDDKSTWGKKVKQLCHGAATNEHRFGVGWLESDGGVWFVHGPMARAATPAALPAAAKPSWCGIASAEENVVLLWRDNNRLLMNVCGKKQCSDLVVRVPIEASETLLGYGCVRDACLFATRDKHGTTKLHRVNERGRGITKTLEHATTDTAVSIVGAGSRAFAVGYLAKDGSATINRVTTDGAFSNVWHFGDTKHAPTLAWANEQLLVALPSGDVHTIEVPR